jgi:D-sedoheptulose 7-phosphate isomerase
VEQLEQLVQVLRRIDLSVVERLAAAIVDCARRKGAVYLFGNGGSAAIAEHFALDLERIATDEERPWPIRATCLARGSARLTAYGNDYGFDSIFSKQLDARVDENDIVIGISTSGASANVVRALRAARTRKAVTVGLTRVDRTPVSRLCDIALEVPATVPALLETVFSCTLYLVTSRIRTMVKME